MPDNVTLFHSPQTRSSGTLALLEELNAPYTLRILDMKAGEHRQPAFMQINPMGKVPAILHGDVLVTEQVAIAIYLADTFSGAGLAPALTDPLRGAYLRWFVFYAASFEPAAVDKALQREAGHAAMSPYGDFATTVSTVTTQLQKGPWMLGDRFTALDVQWGTALTWMTGFGIIEATPPIKAYVERWSARPSVARVREIDEKSMQQKSA